MNWFSIDFSETLRQLSPTFFRGERFEAFNSSSGSALQSLSDDLLYKMQHDCSVIYLEKMLNEQFNISGYNRSNHVATRKIYIADAPFIERDYLHLNQENETIWLFDDDEPDEFEQEYIDVSLGNYYHFVVNIPESIEIDQVKLRALVDYYKLAGKKYIIETYEND